MCENVTEREDALSGEILALCDNAALCLLVLLEIATPNEVESLSMDAEFDFADGAKIPKHWKPGFHLLAAFCDSAETAVIEYNYFDVDYRSELALMQETSFAPMAAGVRRLHFFSTAVGDARPVRLLDVVTSAAVSAAPGKHSAEPPLSTDAPDNSKPVAAPNAPDGERREPYVASAYLGYTIVRPRLSRKFGRSIVTPNSHVRSNRNVVLVEAKKMRAQIRTAVMEPVNIFGVYLVAVGVPFMEQDGDLLRCAHVSAWTCHYTAVLRSAVARRPTGHFSQASGWRDSTGRHYPSGGVSTSEVIAILGNSDMPPEALTRAELRQPRRSGWADRAEMAAAMKNFELQLGSFPPVNRQSIQDKANLKALKDESDWAWTSENVSASVCRYLNSGIPVIIVRRDMRHTQVVTGYFRRSDLADSTFIAREEAKRARELASEEGSGSGDPVKPEPTRLGDESMDTDPGSEVTHFIISDDSDGPFYALSVAEVVSEVVQGVTDFLVPLPRSLWMSGDTAERLGTRLLSQYANQRQLRASEWAASMGVDAAVAQRVIDEFTHRLSKRQFTVRTYATTGVDLKESMQNRLSHDKELVRQFSMIQLPKYVWVVEAIHRQHRKDLVVPNVHAMLVLDASAVGAGDLNSTEPIRQFPPLFVHLPGQMLVPPYAVEQQPSKRPKKEDPRDQHWYPAESKAYATGRWNYEMLMSQSRHRTGNLARGAVAL